MSTRSDFAAAEGSMGLLQSLAERWWAFLLRGLVAVAFGLMALLWPAVTLVALVLLYGAYALADGVIAIIAAVRGRSVLPRWWLVLVGALGIVAGVVTFIWPNITAFALVVIIGAWALIYGVFEIVGAIRLRKEIDNEWLLVLHGVLAVIFGAAMVLLPGAGALALVFVIGWFAIVSGVLLLVFALRLKKHTRAA
jgi:uncharacterized membrane protein HdeD (DUF308 family)